MGSLEDRIRRLEARAGQRQEDAESVRRRRVMDRLYHEQNNARRELDGLDPLPTPPELEESRDEVLDTLRETIPHYREASPGWRGGHGKELLDQLEDAALERLAELEREEQDE